MRAVGVLVVLLVLGAGYLLGRAAAPGATDAAAASRDARQAARRTAERSAADTGRERGYAKGRAEGRRDGRRRGAEIGERQESAEAAELAAARERAAEEKPGAGTATAEDLPLDTPGPTPRGTSCPAPFSYSMGICRIARPARPDECPPGSEPAGETGACAPREP